MKNSFHLRHRVTLLGITFLMLNGVECLEVQASEVPCTNHSSGELKVLKEPSCGKPGEGERSCSVCGEVYQKDVIPALSHTVGDWENMMEPGALTPGKKKRSCTTCGEVMEMQEVSPLYTLTENIALSQTQVNTVPGSHFTLTATGTPTFAEGQPVVWNTWNPAVAVVDQNGNVYTTGQGETYITATTFNGVTGVCRVSTGFPIQYVLNGGKNHSSNVNTFYDATEVTLFSPKKSGYIFEGWYTSGNFQSGQKITELKDKKAYTLYAKWKKAAKPSKVKSLKVYPSANRAIYCTFLSVSDNTKYQIVIATDKNFKKGKKIYTSDYNSFYKDGLKKGKTYYVKVRGYRQDSTGKKYYGKYSSTQKIKIQ